jgi:tripartite-type tricarboxylate transporter receptor subunit TctC
MKRLCQMLAMVFVTSLQAIGGLAAQDWPARPITMVVAFPAGGSDDILGRIMAARLSEILGQQVVVENVGGGGGTVGTARVAKAQPDGYQFILGTSATHAASQAVRKQPPYDATADFTPVALIAEQPFVLIARKDFPADDLRGFAAHAKANEEKLKYSSAGTGSATHLVCARLNAALGIKTTHVPHNGGVPALQALIAGEVDYFCPVVTIAIPEIARNRVKAIAILSGTRMPILPELATAAEQGVPNFAATTWFAAFLPKGTSEPVVQRLHAAIAAAVETPSVQTKLKEIGAEIVTSERRSPSYLRTFVKSEIDKWAGAIKAANIQVE